MRKVRRQQVLEAQVSRDESPPAAARGEGFRRPGRSARLPAGQPCAMRISCANCHRRDSSRDGHVHSHAAPRCATSSRASGFTAARRSSSGFGRPTCASAGSSQAAERSEFEPVPLLWGFAYPSGLVERSAYEQLKQEFLERLRSAGTDRRRAARPARRDGGRGDRRRRRRLHRSRAHATSGRELSDRRHVRPARQPHAAPRGRRHAIVGFDTYPHVDMAERGQRGGRDLIVARIRGEMRPVDGPAPVAAVLEHAAAGDRPSADERSAAPRPRAGAAAGHACGHDRHRLPLGRRAGHGRVGHRRGRRRSRPWPSARPTSWATGSGSAAHAGSAPLLPSARRWRAGEQASRYPDHPGRPCRQHRRRRAGRFHGGAADVSRTEPAGRLAAVPGRSGGRPAGARRRRRTAAASHAGRQVGSHAGTARRAGGGSGGAFATANSPTTARCTPG